MRGRGEAEPGPGPLAEGVIAAHRDSRGRYGAGKVRRAPARKGKAASRRRITGTMKENPLAGAYAKAEFKPHAGGPDEADLPNALDRELDGCAPHAHLASDLACVRVLSAWHCICPLVGLASRETVGHAAGARKDAEPVRSAFATVAFPLFDIDAFHSDRGPEFDNMALDEMLEVFGITRSLSKRGCPYDNAVVESADKMLKAELVYGESFGSLEELQVKLSDYVWWYNHERMHSTLGYMSPVEFREKSLTLMSKWGLPIQTPTSHGRGAFEGGPAVSYQSSGPAAPAPATPPGPSTGQGHWAVRRRPIGSPSGHGAIVSQTAPVLAGAPFWLQLDCNGSHLSLAASWWEPTSEIGR